MTKILIADDNQQNLYLLHFLLEKKGHEVTAVVNGQEALDAARRDPPDMLITDILMPMMDGFTLCRNWQKDPILRTIPLVFYSATYTDEKDIALGLELGAARFIVKPLEPTALYAILEEVLQEFKSGNLPANSSMLDSEPVFLKQYNERLVKKLEDKMVELEAANQRLEEEVAGRTAELKVALAEAQATNRLMSRFISEINHELRTPLNNLVLYLSFIERSSSEKRGEYLSILRRETERLQWLISQLLEATMLEAGGFATNLEPVDINELAGTLVNDRLQLAQNKDMTLIFNGAPDLPLALADSKLLFQALTNLLANAINYTFPGGEVEIRSSVQTKDGRDWVTVMVRDNGIGISEDDKPYLFDRFFRGEAAQVTKATGAGLGLSICQGFMDLLQGKITVESQLGKGSVFTLWLQPAD